MPQNIIQGVKVDGVIYKYDYESLENLPDPELPEYSESADNGYVLTVVDGTGLAWLPALPQYGNSDEGNVLTVGDNGNYLYWEEMSLPEYGSSDAGKLLAVANTGLEWIEPQSSIPNYDNGDSGKTLMVNDTGNDIVWGSPLPDHADQTNAYLQLNDYGEVEWGSSPLPSYNSGAAGLYLGVDENGDLEWASMDSGFPSTDQCTGGEALVVGTSDNAYTLLWRKLLPDFSGDDFGKALVVGSSDDLSGLTFERILPSWSGSDDVGKVLTIDANGNLSWQLPTS